MKQLVNALVSILLIITATPIILAQGTAFTYQGQLVESGEPANGNYDLSFMLFSVNSGAGQIGSTATNPATLVTNGLFTVTLDFGNQFNGASRWLEIGVRTNGGNGFVTLVPRQKILATPYALTASNLSGILPASQLSGTLSNSQLANSSITLNAGPGMSGGGTVTLGGTTTFTNSGVRSVTGNSDITASTANGTVTLGSTATSANIANTIVKRDSSGNLLAGSVTLSTNLILPVSSASAGIIYMGTNTLVHARAPQNFFAGVNAGNLTMAGACNTGMGWLSLRNNTSGDNNTGLGFTALLYNTNGHNNTAVGYAALYNNQSGLNNTANGMQALYMNSIGSYNTAYGAYALFYNWYGSYNTASGYRALRNNEGGSHNTADGQTALEANTVGEVNTAMGAAALRANRTGNNNTAVGGGALDLPETSSYNTAIGADALGYHWQGDHNVAIGYQAGYNVYAGSSNIFIANLGSEGDNCTIRLGTQGIHTNASVAGIFGTTISSGVSVYVDSSGQLGTITSSARYKEDIQCMGDESGVLFSLRPVTFRYKPEIDSKRIPQFGVVAEEVAEVAPQLVVRDENGDVYSVRYEAINAMLLNEFLKQHEKLELQIAEIERLKEQISKIDSLAKRVRELEASLQAPGN